MRILIAAAFAAALFTVGVGCKKDSASADSGGGPGSASLEGDYMMTGLNVGGDSWDELITKSSEEERLVTIKGDKLTMNSNKQKKSQTIKVNGTKTPAEIDMTRTDDDGKSKTVYAIYKIEGGVLTICGPAAEEPKLEDRPKDFTPSDKVMIMTMKKK